MSILVTGGTGFIGSHTCVELLNAGEEIVVVDNFYNSKETVVSAIKKITNKEFTFYNCDVCDRKSLKSIFSKNSIDSVIHFASYKAVNESVTNPLMYYTNNVSGACTLLDVMKEFNCKRFVFSSSATVYGSPEKVPIIETAPLKAVNPYGNTKIIIENICNDLYASDNSWSIALLRYFNPIGAHGSGKIGESPNGIPNNIMPIIIKVAARETTELSVFGCDYPTKDGTCVRDYIHVTDLALGHISAIKKVRESTGIEAYNLGTGNGYSVLEIINTFEKINNIKIPYNTVARRAGDVAECYCNPQKSYDKLNWKAERTLEQMCLDTWNFAKQKLVP